VQRLQASITAESMPDAMHGDLNIPQLNGDVIETIVEHIHPEIPFGSPDFDINADWKKRPFQVFASLCLVSRSWLPLARRHLFRVLPPFDSQSQDFTSFFQCIEKYPELRSHILRLHAYLRYFDERLLTSIRSFSQCVIITQPDIIPISDQPAMDNLRRVARSLGTLCLNASVKWPKEFWLTGFDVLRSLHELRITGCPFEFS
jgi:hypothetical protein